MINKSKQGLFTRRGADRAASRRSPPSSATSQVESFHGLLVDFCKQRDIPAIVKGLRAVSDFDYELQMAQMNIGLSGVETLFVPTNPAYSFLSSSLVKEVAQWGGDISHLVPPPVLEALNAKLEAAVELSVVDVQKKLDEIAAAVANARSMPMSASCVVNRAELLAMLDEVAAALPDSLSQAQDLLGDREQMVAAGAAPRPSGSSSRRTPNAARWSPTPRSPGSPRTRPSGSSPRPAARPTRSAPRPTTTSTASWPTSRWSSPRPSARSTAAARSCSAATRTRRPGLRRGRPGRPRAQRRPRDAAPPRRRVRRRQARRLRGGAQQDPGGGRPRPAQAHRPQPDRRPGRPDGRPDAAAGAATRRHHRQTDAELPGRPRRPAPPSRPTCPVRLRAAVPAAQWTPATATRRRRLPAGRLRAGGYEQQQHRQTGLPAAAGVRAAGRLRRPVRPAAAGLPARTRRPRLRQQPTSSSPATTSSSTRRRSRTSSRASQGRATRSRPRRSTRPASSTPA